MPQGKKSLGVSATAVLYAKDANAFLLIKRKWNPFKGQWAFPGGLLETDRENVYTTAVRELEEETGLKMETDQLELFAVLSEPRRDPRRHVVDVAFYATVEQALPINDSDETFAKWISVKDANDLTFAYGHRELYEKAVARIEAGN